MTEERAVAPHEQQVGLDVPTQRVLSVATVGDAERFEQAVTIPAIYMYAMNRYNQPPKVSLTSEAYSYLNRVMGVQLFQPEHVNDANGDLVNNPIHRPDYIYLRMVGIWRNDLGQMVSYREDVEVDYNLVYQDARINARSAKVATNADGSVIFENGMPKVVLDAADELKALKALSQLRTFGIRYAQTVAATRILKRASGISSLPITAPQNFSVKVVGFRDALTPDERIRQAEQNLSTMFGKGTVVREDAALTADEMADIREFEPSDMTDDLDHTIVESHVVGDSFDAGPRRVGPDDEEQGTIFDATPRRNRQA